MNVSTCVESLWVRGYLKNRWSNNFTATKNQQKLKYLIKSNYQIDHISTYCIPNAGVCLISIYAGDLANHAKVCRSSLCIVKLSSFCEVCSDSFVESSVSPVHVQLHTVFFNHSCVKSTGRLIQICDSFVTNSVSQVSNDGFVTVFVRSAVSVSVWSVVITLSLTVSVRSAAKVLSGAVLLMSVIAALSIAIFVSSVVSLLSGAVLVRSAVTVLLGTVSVS